MRLEALEDRIVPSSVQGYVTDTSTKLPLSNWTVWLDVNNDKLLDSGDVKTTTDANGHYFFDTTYVSPAVPGSNADILRLDLPVGTGGRWVNTTPIDAIIFRSQTPDATLNFGAKFQQDTGVQPAGPESVVHGMQQDTQLGGPSVSADAVGNHVVTWEDSTGEPYARVVYTNGTSTGDIDVGAGLNPGSSNPSPRTPLVAMAGNGEFVVAWTATDGIHTQAFSLDGTTIGKTNTVLAFNSKLRGGLSGIAADSTGDFVVVYNAETYSKGTGWSTPIVYAQQYTSSGSANRRAIKVATPKLINGVQSVAMDGAGNFVVAWDDVAGARGTTGPYIYAQQYTASGKTIGSQITVASGTGTANGMTLTPSVAMNSNGDFVVTYEVWGSSPMGRAKMYNANGTATGPAVEFAVSGEPDYTGASVAMDDAGNVLLAWSTTGLASPSNPNGGITGPTMRYEVRMAYLPAGNTTGGILPETIVNTTTQGSHQTPGVAATGNGNFVVVWQGIGAPDPAGIYSQQYIPLASPATMSTLSRQSTTSSTALPTALSVQPTSGTATSAPLLENTLQTPGDSFAASSPAPAPSSVSLLWSAPLDEFARVLSFVEGQLILTQERIDQVFTELAAELNSPHS